MSGYETSRKLLGDANVARWHANLQEGSETTADTYLRRLRRFCNEHKTTPQALAEVTAKDAYSILLDSVAYYRRKGYASSTIKGYLKPIKSWLIHNDITLTKKVNIKGANRTPTLKNEKTPEPYVLHSVWRFCDERQAAVIALLAFTGLRPQTLGDYRGNDGLRIQDLPELEVDNEKGEVTFKTIPTRIIVREEISKMGNTYESLLCQEGCAWLKTYLQKRIRSGERIVAQSAVISDDLGDGVTVTTKTIGKVGRKAFRHAGFQWRPYILRRFFDTRMGQAVAKAEIGLLDEWVKFWMGHQGDIEAIYRLRKRLPDSLLEQMREAYRRASESMLQTIDLHREDAGRMRREFRATALSMLGFSDDEIKGVDLDKATMEQLQELVKRKLGLVAKEDDGNGRRQLVVTAKEAKDYINNRGWQFKGSMATGEVVIEEPASGPAS